MWCLAGICDTKTIINLNMFSAKLYIYLSVWKSKYFQLFDTKDHNLCYLWPSNISIIYKILQFLNFFYFFHFNLFTSTWKSIRRKTTRMKYDPPYTKKSIGKSYGGSGNANHHSVEEVSLDGSNKLITYGNTFR